MRTNVDIDNELMTKAMKAMGLPTKKATIEEALRRVVKDHSLKQALDELEGIGWEGDLEETRLSWSPGKDQ